MNLQLMRKMKQMRKKKKKKESKQTENLFFYNTETGRNYTDY